MLPILVLEFVSRTGKTEQLLYNNHTYYFDDDDVDELDAIPDVDDFEKLGNQLGIDSRKMLTPEEIDQFNDSLDEVMFNYVKSLTNQEVLDEMRAKKLEFYNSDEVEAEIKSSLDPMCSAESIDAEVRKIWIDGELKRKQIRTKDRKRS